MPLTSIGPPAAARSRYARDRESESCDRRTERNPEEPVVADNVDDRPCQDRADRATDSENAENMLMTAGTFAGGNASRMTP